MSKTIVVLFRLYCSFLISASLVFTYAMKTRPELAEAVSEFLTVDKFPYLLMGGFILLAPVPLLGTRLLAEKRARQNPVKKSADAHAHSKNIRGSLKTSSQDDGADHLIVDLADAKRLFEKQLDRAYIGVILFSVIFFGGALLILFFPTHPEKPDPMKNLMLIGLFSLGVIVHFSDWINFAPLRSLTKATAGEATQFEILPTGVRIPFILATNPASYRLSKLKRSHFTLGWKEIEKWQVFPGQGKVRAQYLLEVPTNIIGNPRFGILRDSLSDHEDQILRLVKDHLGKGLERHDGSTDV